MLRAREGEIKRDQKRGPGHGAGEALASARETRGPGVCTAGRPSRGAAGGPAGRGAAPSAPRAGTPRRPRSSGSRGRPGSGPARRAPAAEAGPSAQPLFDAATRRAGREHGRGRPEAGAAEGAAARRPAGPRSCRSRTDAPSRDARARAPNEPRRPRIDPPRLPLRRDGGGKRAAEAAEREKKARTGGKTRGEETRAEGGRRAGRAAAW